MLRRINQYNIEAGRFVKYRLHNGQMVEVKVKGHVQHSVGLSRHRLFTILYNNQLQIAMPEELFIETTDVT